MDPRILLSARGIQMQSPMELESQRMQLQGAMQAQQLNQMRMQQAQAEIEQNKRLQAREVALEQGRQKFWQGMSADPQITPRKLAEARFLGVNLDELKKFAESPNWGRSKVSLTDTGGQLQRVDEYGNIVGPAISKTQTPGETSRAEQAALEFEALKQYRANQLATTRRGQDLSASTAAQRLAFDRENPSMATVTTEDGVFQVPNRGGTGQQVMGPDGRPLSGKPLTEGQANAAIYGERAMQAEEALSKVDGEIGTAERTGMAVHRGLSGLPLVGGIAQLAGNALSTDEMRQADQAQRNFINATLRRESGAVISPEEFDNARLQYFPQPGDDPQTLALKKQNRETVIKGLQRAAGSAKQELQRPNIAAQPPRQGEVRGAIRQPAGQQLNDLPDPSQVPPGAEIIDNQTGQRLINDGNRWVPQ